MDALDMVIVINNNSNSTTLTLTVLPGKILPRTLAKYARYYFNS